MKQARENNRGWRLDYFVTSKSLIDQVKDSEIYSEVKGSDHCPIGLTLSLKSEKASSKKISTPKK